MELDDIQSQVYGNRRYLQVEPLWLCQCGVVRTAGKPKHIYVSFSSPRLIQGNTVFSKSNQSRHRPQSNIYGSPVTVVIGFYQVKSYSSSYTWKVSPALTSERETLSDVLGAAAVAECRCLLRLLILMSNKTPVKFYLTAESMQRAAGHRFVLAVVECSLSESLNSQS